MQFPLKNDFENRFKFEFQRDISSDLIENRWTDYFTIEHMSDEHTLYTIDKLIHTWRVKDTLERTSTLISAVIRIHMIYPSISMT